MMNLFYGVLVSILAGVFFFSTFTLPAEQRGLNPRLYPQFISLCLFFLSLSLAISGIRVLLKRKGQGGGEKSFKASTGEVSTEQATERVSQAKIVSEGGKIQGVEPSRMKRKPLFALIGIVIASFGYVFVVDIVGYLVATPPFIGITMFLFGEKRIVRILLVSLLSSGLLYYLFRIIFRVPLPVSTLW